MGRGQHVRRWWRRLLPSAPTVEEIKKEMLANASKLTETPVLYYREQERFWRRHMYKLQALLALVSGVTVALHVRVMTVFYLLLAFWLGTRWEFAHRRRVEAARDAWQAENEATLQGMADGGLLNSPRDMIEIMRDTDPPPGMSKERWVAQHDDLLRSWDERHGQ
jgi:hypothetical protein